MKRANDGALTQKAPSKKEAPRKRGQQKNHELSTSICSGPWPPPCCRATGASFSSYGSMTGETLSDQASWRDQGFWGDQGSWRLARELRKISAIPRRRL